MYWFPSLSRTTSDDLETMELNTNRLLDLVNQLLDFRKTETQGFQLNFVECDVSELLQKTYKRFKPLAREKGLALSIETPESLYASVDREGLTKIISNLLTNAIKYSETYIRIRLYSEGERLLLSVCNDGLVIPVEMREEIFKPFIQHKTGTAALCARHRYRACTCPFIGRTPWRYVVHGRFDGEQLFPAVTSAEARADGGYGA